jgi:DNA-binding transcriptional LysR family regulator
MELQQLRYVEAIAAHRHFTRAAMASQISQPALSHKIKLLEQELGVQLFERSRRGARLTEAGELLLRRARRVLAEVDAARHEIASLKGLKTGHVLLGAMQALGGLKLPRLISQFHRQNPNIQVSLRDASTTREMLNMVVTDHLDLAIVALDVERPSTIEAVPLVRERLVMGVPRSHKLATAGSVKLEQFADEQFVFLGRGTGLRAITEGAAHNAGFTPRVGFETSSLERILALVAEGLGVALVPASTVEGRQLPELAAIPVQPAVHRTVGVVWRAKRQHAPATDAFIALLQRHGDPSFNTAPRPGPAVQRDLQLIEQLTDRG